MAELCSFLSPKGEQKTPNIGRSYAQILAQNHQKKKKQGQAMPNFQPKTNKKHRKIGEAKLNFLSPKDEQKTQKC